MPDRDDYPTATILLPPGTFRVLGIPPMTGLLLDKWIHVTADNLPGCYGPADIPIATAIPNPLRIEDEAGLVVWPEPS